MEILKAILNATHTIISVMGEHAGEGTAKIFARKKADIDSGRPGWTLWLTRSDKAKPDSVQKLCGKQRETWVIFIEPSAPDGARPTESAVPACSYSADRARWKRLPSEMSPVTGKIDGGAYALAFDQIHFPVSAGDLNLWDYADFSTPSSPIRPRLGGSTICAMKKKDMSRHPDRIKSRPRRIVALARLTPPFAVWLCADPPLQCSTKAAKSLCRPDLIRGHSMEMGAPDENAVRKTCEQLTGSTDTQKEIPSIRPCSSKTSDIYLVDGIPNFRAPGTTMQEMIWRVEQRLNTEDNAEAEAWLDSAKAWVRQVEANRRQTEEEQARTIAHEREKRAQIIRERFKDRGCLTPVQMIALEVLIDIEPRAATMGELQPHMDELGCKARSHFEAFNALVTLGFAEVEFIGGLKAWRLSAVTT